MILVTGGAGFIGSNFIYHLIQRKQEKIVILDNFTYAANFETIKPLIENKICELVVGNIDDYNLLCDILNKFKPTAIVNFAAETHVDRSILSPEKFISTNIFGTFRLLEASRGYYEKLTSYEKAKFRFIHISTDEVFGSLEKDENSFTESSSYQPNSPYSASKASSDHIVRSWYHTYKFPAIITNCSNNYGPYQFPEKLIPLIIINALNQEALPIYGDGKQIRDWLYVDDHCVALSLIIDRGHPGETYNIGGNCQITNLEVVTKICNILDEIKPLESNKSYNQLIKFVDDRPGHDRRYAINSSKISSCFGVSIFFPEPQTEHASCLNVLTEENSKFSKSIDKNFSEDFGFVFGGNRCGCLDASQTCRAHFRPARVFSGPKHDPTGGACYGGVCGT